MIAQAIGVITRRGQHVGSPQRSSSRVFNAVNAHAAPVVIHHASATSTQSDSTLTP